MTKTKEKEPLKETSTKRLVPLFREYIEKSRKSDSTKRAYRTTLRHLTEYQKARKLTIQTTDLTLKRYDDIINFLLNEIEQPDGTIGLSDNTIGTFTKRLKVVIKYLQERDYQITINPADLKVVMTAAPIYFLTEEEIKILDDFKFEEERLTRVKDIFIFNCYTGLRISDLSRLRSHHIVDGVIKLRTYKNQKDTFNPLISRSKEILEKYDYKLPMISEQKYNQYIKEACMKVGIDHPVEIVKRSSGNKSYSIAPKWSVVSTHTAIKTFISLCGAKGISAKAVSEMTGKSVEVILKHYYGIDKKTIKDQMKASFG